MVKKTTAQVFDVLENGMPADQSWEQLILSMAVQYHERVDELASAVIPADFSSDRNRLVWIAIKRLHESGIAPDCYALAQNLTANRELEAAGGLGYLVDLASPPVPNVPNVRKYVAILREYSVRRRAVLHGNELMLMASDRKCDTAELLASASTAVQQMAADLKPETSFLGFAESIAQQGGMNTYTGASGASEGAILTHLPTLNYMMPAGGLRPGELAILAALTSRGKTAWALNMARHVSQRGKGVALVSMEMDEASIYDRLMSMGSGMDLYALRRPFHGDAEQDRKDRLRGAAGQLAEMPISVWHAPGVTPSKLTAQLRRLQAVKPLGLVIVDYLQLMSSGMKAGGSREENVTAISRGLKRMASDLSVPVLALSQFSRDTAKTERKPRLDDLRESGAIEQDANIVMFIHFTRLWDTKSGIANGEAELIIAKQRNGALGVVRMNFHAPTGIFSEIE